MVVLESGVDVADFISNNFADVDDHFQDFHLMDCVLDLEGVVLGILEVVFEDFYYHFHLSNFFQHHR